MSLTICYKSTRQVAADEADVIRSAARRECHGRSWLSCEPVSFFPDLKEGTLLGGSKPNPAADRDDTRTVPVPGLPDGTPRDLLDVLARLSQEHAIDWELTIGSRPVGFIRNGLIDPQAATQMEALMQLASPDFRGDYGREIDQLLRKIQTLCSSREHGNWWDREIGWSRDKEKVLRKAQARYNELLQRARENGWEIRS